MDRFSKTCLLICILLLAVIAIRPIVTPPSAHAANQYKYLVISAEQPVLRDGHLFRTEQMQKDIDKQANDGWEFVSPIVTPIDPTRTLDPSISQPLLVFRKER